jgi:hypothetical protein
VLITSVKIVDNGIIYRYKFVNKVYGTRKKEALMLSFRFGIENQGSDEVLL